LGATKRTRKRTIDDLEEGHWGGTSIGTKTTTKDEMRAHGKKGVKNVGERGESFKTSEGEKGSTPKDQILAENGRVVQKKVAPTSAMSGVRQKSKRNRASEEGPSSTNGRSKSRYPGPVGRGRGGGAPIHCKSLTAQRKDYGRKWWRGCSAPTSEKTEGRRHAGQEKRETNSRRIVSQYEKIYAAK